MVCKAGRSPVRSAVGKSIFPLPFLFLAVTMNDRQNRGGFFNASEEDRLAAKLVRRTRHDGRPSHGQSGSFFDSPADGQFGPAALQYGGFHCGRTVYRRYGAGGRRHRRAHPKPAAGSVHGHRHGRQHSIRPVFRRARSGDPEPGGRRVHSADGHQRSFHDLCGLFPVPMADVAGIAAPRRAGRGRHLPADHLHRHSGRRGLQHSGRCAARAGRQPDAANLSAGGQPSEHRAGHSVRQPVPHGRSGRGLGDHYRAGRVRGHVPGSPVPDAPCGGREPADAETRLVHY